MERVYQSGSPLVYVIIPCYNHGRYLNETIESILNPSNKNLEILVVDNGSTDNPKSVAGSYSNIRYVYQNTMDFLQPKIPAFT